MKLIQNGEIKTINIKKEKNKTKCLWIVIAILLIINIATIIYSSITLIKANLKIREIELDRNMNYIPLWVVEEE